MAASDPDSTPQVDDREKTPHRDEAATGATMHVQPETARTIGVSDSRIARRPAPAPDARDAEGKPFGRYRLLEELGRGGMGVVWKAWDTQLRRIVALKQILSEGGITAAQAERFLREARLAAKLRHAAIVGVLDVGAHEEQPFFTTEYIEGRPLDLVLKDKVAPRQAVAWAKCVAEALGYAHDPGVIHRDVKPGNILIDAQGRPFVMDFGLAKEVELGGVASAPLTLSGALVGTPHYMSPEQAKGQTDRLGPASDQFSLGVVLYEMLTRTAPFEGTALRDVLNAISDAEPVPPTTLNPQLHRDLETVCLKTLEKQPSRRYASMGELAKDLGRYLEGEPIAARPLSTVGRVARKAYKHRWTLLPTAAALLIALSAGAYLLVQRYRHHSEVMGALSRAQQHEKAGDVKAAREAFKEAIDLDASCPEAQTGYARTGAELERREKEADDARRHAIAEKDSAEAAVRKARLVQGVLSRWALLATTLQEMERVWSDSTLSPGTVRERNAKRWKEVDDFLQETLEDPTSRATALAFAAMAAQLAGREGDQQKWLEESRKLDPDLPFASLFEAFSLLDRILVAETPQSAAVTPGSAFAGAPSRENAALRELRARSERLLAEAGAAKVWGEGMADDMRHAIDALRAVQAGKHAEAEEGLTLALKGSSLLSFRSQILLARSRMRYLQGKFEEGLADVVRVMEVRSEDANVHYLRGIFLASIGEAKQARSEDGRPQLEQAVVEIGEAIRRQPDSPTGYVARASLRNALGDTAAAMQDYDRALLIDPRCSDALVNRGTMREAQGDVDRAIEDYESAARIDPACAAIHVDLGNAWLKKNDLARSAEEYERAVRLDPRLVLAWKARAEMRKSQGDLAGAEADLSEAIRNSPEVVEVWLQRGLVRMARRNVDGAIEDFTAGLKLNPSHLACLGQRARAKEAKGDVAGAIADLDTGLKAAPGNADLLFERARVEQDAGQADAALADYDATIKADPKIAEAFADRAILRRARGDRNGALSDEDEALRLDPSRADVWCNRGNLKADLGDPEGAERDYTECLRCDAKNDKGRHARSRLRMGRRDFAGVMEDASDFISRHPDDIEMLTLRSNSEVMLGKSAEAIADIEHLLQIAPADWPDRAGAEEWLKKLRGK